MCLFLSAAMGLVACGDDSGTGPDASADITALPDVRRDSQALEGGADATPLEHNIGVGCSESSECLSDSPVCIMWDTTEKRGICSMECTPDNPSTPFAVEDNCPSGFVCGEFSYSTDTYYYCLKTCTPSIEENPCPESSGQTCSPASSAFVSMGETVCWYGACKSHRDCPVFSAIECTEDARCTEELGSESFCLSGYCAFAGNCTPGGICGAHSHGRAEAKIGDPCASDLDCTNQGFCFGEADGYPNGYCASGYCDTGLAGFECPAEATCHRLFYGGVCHKRCDQAVAGDCRGVDADKGGDYECYAWDNLTIADRPISEAAICTVVANESCDGLGGDLDCTVLGSAGSLTNMVCRDRLSGEVLDDSKDPLGYCLDDSASGDFPVDVDAGTPEAGTPEAGVDAGAGTPEAGVDAGVEAGTPEAGTPEAG